jgi:hypothetical protein
VLDDGDCGGARGIEFGDAFKRRVGVVEVVVGQLLALHLARGRDAETQLAGAVERRLLVRVLAIAQRLGEGSCNNTPRR